VSPEEKVQALKYMLASDGWREVVEPALKISISGLENQWINGFRTKGQEGLTDEAIKGRIWSLVWMQSWPQRLDNLARMVEEELQAEQKTVDHGEGGSPY